MPLAALKASMSSGRSALRAANSPRAGSNRIFFPGVDSVNPIACAPLSV